MKGMVERVQGVVDPRPRALTLIREGKSFAVVGVTSDIDAIGIRPDSNELIGARVVCIRRRGR